MIRLHREPLLPQRVTSSKPCNDDSTIPTPALQEVKVNFFGGIDAIGIWKSVFAPIERLQSPA
jgi:hypothetical protein